MIKSFIIYLTVVIYGLMITLFCKSCHTIRKVTLECEEGKLPDGGGYTDNEKVNAVMHTASPVKPIESVFLSERYLK